MGLLDNDKYVKADINGHETEIESLISDYIDSLKGATEEEQRQNLPILKNDVQGATDYVMENKTTVNYRVDGYVLRPLLKNIVNEKIKDLPALLEDEEI